MQQKGYLYSCVIFVQIMSKLMYFFKKKAILPKHASRQTKQEMSGRVNESMFPVQAASQNNDSFTIIVVVSKQEISHRFLKVRLE